MRQHPPHNPPRHSTIYPAQTTPFIGRAAELSDLATLIEAGDVRLVTILAPGGMGKTRLALEAAAQQIDNFPGGVFFVPLAPLTAAEQLLPAIATTLGYQFQNDQRSHSQQLVDFLQPKQTLLVLDNFEHLLAGASLVAEMLQGTPDIMLLVTSRERLNLNGETVYLLGGLPIPQADGAPNDLLQVEACALFLQGAQRARTGFELRESDWQPLITICKLVEGMPLAMVLAAAWVEVLTIPEIAQEIQQSMDFLAAEMVDMPQRHWSIRAVMDATWQRLTPAQQQMFMCLAVTRGGFDRHAAQDIAGAGLRDLQSFVNKALLARDDDGRYHIHELLRQYAESLLGESGQFDAARDAHAEYYTAATHRRLDDLKGRDQHGALHSIEADFENIRLAWTWYLSHARYADALRMTESVGWFFKLRGRFLEGRDWFATAAQISTDADTDARMLLCYTLLWQSRFLNSAWQREDGLVLARQAMALAEELSDAYLMAGCLHAMSRGMASTQDADTGKRLCQ